MYKIRLNDISISTDGTNVLAIHILFLNVLSSFPPFPQRDRSQSTETMYTSHDFRRCAKKINVKVETIAFICLPIISSQHIVTDINEESTII